MGKIEKNIIKSENRRDFLKASGAGVGGLALGFSLQIGSKVAHAATSHSPNAWIKIGTDNVVSIMVARSEMGQDVYTSMPMLVAEELNVDLDKIKVEFAPPAEVYINALLGGQLTGGSTSVRDAWEKLRKAGASARMMLVAAAADDWGVDASKCSASSGMVKGPGGKKATYGDLAEKAATMEVPKEVPLKAKSEWKYIGNVKQPRLDTKLKVMGQAGFGIDVVVPGMLYAAVWMPPQTMGAKITSYDDSRAKNVPGVKAVVQYSRGIAVVADSYWTAKKAKELLSVKWDKGPSAGKDMGKIWEELELASVEPGVTFREAGNFDEGIGKASKKLSAEYRSPFKSHSPLEPQNTTADVRGDKAIIITPTQFQQIIPHVVSGAIGLKPEQIEVKTTFLGGGFGRRVETDYAIDAAEISKAVGAPVKMVWDRETDMMHDSYSPNGIYKLEAGLDSGGKIAAMRYKAASPSISAVLFPSLVKDGVDPFAVEGIDNYPYDTPDIKFSYQLTDVGIRPGYWRGVSHNNNVPALECFMDECAHAAGQDPIDYRISQLDMDESGAKKHAWSGLSSGVPEGKRMKKCLEEVKVKSNWGKKMAKGRGQGVAVMEGYNTVIATVVEVTVDDNNNMTLDKITAVADAGQLVHPDQALAQMQSCFVYGQAVGMYSEITIEDGAAAQDNFDTYIIPRNNQVPKVMDIHFVESDGSFVGGLGEPGTAVIVPAIANALFAATGKRVREFPLTPERIASA